MNPAPLRLVADVGGTHARFALLDAAGRPERVRVLICARYPDLVSAVEAYLAELGGLRPSEAVIAIANPVTGDLVTMTNHHWSFSIQVARSQLGLERLIVVNDFAALAMSVPALAGDDLLQVGGGQIVSGAPMALIGPGTGLGVASLVRAGGHWMPLAGEGGHVTLPAMDAFEADIIALLRRRFGHVSAERVLSGPGLLALYETLCALRKKSPEALTPADITERALATSDPLCEEALTTFCAMLGTVTGNLALTLGAHGGVYLGGGILPRLGGFFTRSPFRARFEDKGRFAAYLAPIPCFVIQAEQPALTGAGRFFDNGMEAGLVTTKP